VDLIRADRRRGKCSVVKIGLSKFIHYIFPILPAIFLICQAKNTFLQKKIKNVLLGLVSSDNIALTK
jgi:hypothetical protein